MIIADWLAYYRPQFRPQAIALLEQAEKAMRQINEEYADRFYFWLGADAEKH